jgi:hypothetical protein
MALMLVANRRGKRVICWGGFAKLVLMVTPLPAVIAVGVHYLVRHGWSTEVLLIGLGAGFGIAVIILIAALCTPIHKLPFMS